MFVYDISKKKSIPYCEPHLPRFLQPRKIAGLLRTTEQYAAEAASATEVLSTKAKTKKEAPVTPSE
jgi:hypothetical protein